MLHCIACAQATKLVELLDEAKNRCKSTIKDRRGEDITEEELENSSSIMGYGAIKYADLKNNRKTDYKQASTVPLHASTLPILACLPGLCASSMLQTPPACA